MDKSSALVRSHIMRSVKVKHTGPEMAVRKLIWAMGYRYRLHDKTLPGTPDIVLSKYKKVIFVSGCFWHGHNCSKGKLPKSNIEFWTDKIDKNRCRDKKAIKLLKAEGWTALTIWQCHIKNEKSLRNKLVMFLK